MEGNQQLHCFLVTQQDIVLSTTGTISSTSKINAPVKIQACYNQMNQTNKQSSAAKAKGKQVERNEREQG